ncbi:MAG: alanine racemase [Leucobacter sp.]
MRTAEVSLPAIRHNVRHIRELTGGTVIAVVKANGYGHDAVSCAQAAVEAGAGIIAVADLEEALQLRAAGVYGPILCWLHGTRVDFEAAVAEGIEIGINGVAQLDALAAAARKLDRLAVVQIKVDTGLSRNGAPQDTWGDVFARAAELERSGVIRVRGIFSHLANAGANNDRAQAAVFDRAVEELRAAGIDPELVHLAATAATLSSPHLHYNAVRVGVGVYGLSPFPDRTSADLGLIPAMTLKSEIISLRDVPAGTGVSYGHNYVCAEDTTLALVPMGYADGMPRALNGAGASVAIAGQHRPIVGRIGMDQFIVDLGTLSGQVELGEAVVLFGDPERGAPPVEVWAELMRTINYEIVVGIGARVVRVPVEDPA